MRLGVCGLIVAFWATSAVADEIHFYHCLLGCPLGAPSTNDLVIREIYILSSNDDTKFSDWAAYRITAETIGPTQSRNWKADPVLAENETLEPRGPDDYVDANAELGTDRGHQVPLASFTGTEHWRDTNYLSNITPQRADLNQGPWNDLEGAVRDLLQQPSIEAVYGMTGPLYERNMPNLPGANEPHIIPSGYWKIIAVRDDDMIRVAAFVLDQETPRDADYCDHRVTVSEIERRSALTFFHEIPSLARAVVVADPGSLAADLGCPVQ